LPISNSWLNNNNDFSSLIEALSGIELSGTGGNAYRYASSAKVSVSAGTKLSLVPATTEKVHREISIKLISGEFVNLGWGRLWIESLRLLRLDPLNSVFKDVSDGGLELFCWTEQPAELEIIVRSDKPINYLIGGIQPVVIVGVRLLIDTTKDYAENISDLEIHEKVDEITGSDENLTGHKLFQITGFNPHEEITFTVDASSATSFNGDKINVQFLSNVELIKLLFKVGINTFLQVTVPELISGEGDLGDCFTHAVLIPGITGGTFTIKPDFGFNVCRFVVRNPFSGKGDTAIITGYTPNETNPQQGGTFTLGGF
jgi:hypothetical protein